MKDSFDTAGLTTTYRSQIFADHVPERSAWAVTRLEASGYGVVPSARPSGASLQEPARFAAAFSVFVSDVLNVPAELSRWARINH